MIGAMVQLRAACNPSVVRMYTWCHEFRGVMCCLMSPFAASGTVHVANVASRADQSSAFKVACLAGSHSYIKGREGLTLSCSAQSGLLSAKMYSVDVANHA
jgi:hypothetical protein